MLLAFPVGGGDPMIVIATHKLDEPNRKSGLTLVCNYCPFCGAKVKK